MARKAKPATGLVACPGFTDRLRNRSHVPAHELDPPDRLVEALRKVFGTFFPKNPRQWWRLEVTLTNWYADHHYNDPSAYQRFVDELYPSWGPDDVIGFLVEIGLVEKVHSTKPKRRDLGRYRLLLAARMAQDRGLDEHEALLAVDELSHQAFADAIAVEFEFEVCAKTVMRWRKKEAEAQRHRGTSPPRAASPQSKSPTGGKSSRARYLDHSEAKQAGLSTRTRPDAATKLAAGKDPADLVERRRQLDRMAKAVIAGEFKCQCRDTATKLFDDKPVCDDCYAELTQEAVVA